MCFASSRDSNHQLRPGDTSPSPAPCALAQVPLCAPTTKSPLVPRALRAIALARTHLAAQPWLHSSNWFNDGQTTPPGVPLQGALKKQAGPGVRPAGMDGTELGAHSCDTHPCASTLVHTHGCSCMRVHSSTSIHDHAHACTCMIVQTCSCSGTHMHTHTCVHMYGHTHTRAHSTAVWHGSSMH